MATQARATTATTANTATDKSKAADDSTHPMVDKVQETLHASVDKLASSASRAEENLRTTASDSAENMSAQKRLAQKKWLASPLRRYPIENPVATAGIAFAAGMLITSLMRKK